MEAIERITAAFAGMHHHLTAFIALVAIGGLLLTIVPLTMTELRDARRVRRLDKIGGLGDLRNVRRR